MTTSEIDLARAYLAGSDQDPIAALIWAVKDLASTRRLVPSRHERLPGPMEGTAPAAPNARERSRRIVHDGAN